MKSYMKKAQHSILDQRRKLCLVCIFMVIIESCQIVLSTHVLIHTGEFPFQSPSFTVVVPDRSDYCHLYLKYNKPSLSSDKSQMGTTNLA